MAAKGNRRVDRRRLGPPVALEALASKGLGCRYVGLGGAARWSGGLPQRQGNHEEAMSSGTRRYGEVIGFRPDMASSGALRSEAPPRAELDGPVRMARARNAGSRTRAATVARPTSAPTPPTGPGPR